jgi:hypothetical protein
MLLQKIKDTLSKQEHQFISVEEFCSYTGLKMEQVQPLLLG